MPVVMRWSGSFHFLAMVSLVSAGAPDDVSHYCVDKLPMYPQNTRILMDSYNYINLLPPHSKPVWQQLDSDSNNQPGRGTKV